MTSNDRNQTDEPADSRTLETATATAVVAGGGIAATAGTATAQDTEDVVVKARDYYPNEAFVVLTDFEERNRSEFLEEYDDGEDAFDDHDDWDVYSILIEAGEPAGELAVMMIDNDVDPSPGDRGTMGESPSFWNTEWDLLEVDATFNDDEDENDEADDDEADDDEAEADDDEDEENDDGILG
ncbi:calcium-binding protein [Natrialba sp. INN-245]|uniref:calcium-binding protein n=1 Tax=Natrialba sp. INN-245 TaxID=2690967 RepID=UPI0013129378|nr:calcium-binding protein [Natrialba sp. INN-245]MWV39805.1 calcium-binding protein [Natrialba sp. INN-245]